MNINAWMRFLRLGTRARAVCLRPGSLLLHQRLAHKIIIALASVVALFLWSLPPGRATEGLTFSKDIAPLFFKNCVECHRPGENAPFSSLTYKDVREKV